jgi:N-acetylmuramoyl-L-alanine amidase
VNVPPIGFNQVRIKIQIEGMSTPLDLIDMEVPGVVVIDPGHGGQDSGAVGRTDTSILEKDLALEYSLSLRQKVIDKFAAEKHGLKMVMTRKTTGEYMENAARANLARDRGADLFLSIHFNSDSSTTARGTEYVTRSTGQVNAAEDDPLGVSVQSSTLAAVRASDAGATHRDPKSGEFAVISDSSYGNTADYHPIRGVIIEVEFLSHETALESVKLSNATGTAIKTKFAADVSTDLYNNILNQP